MDDEGYIQLLEKRISNYFFLDEDKTKLIYILNALGYKSIKHFILYTLEMDKEFVGDISASDAYKSTLVEKVLASKDILSKDNNPSILNTFLNAYQVERTNIFLKVSDINEGQDVLNKIINLLEDINLINPSDFIKERIDYFVKKKNQLTRINTTKPPKRYLEFGKNQMNSDLIRVSVYLHRLGYTKSKHDFANVFISHTPTIWLGQPIYLMYLVNRLHNHCIEGNKKMRLYSGNDKNGHVKTTYDYFTFRDTVTNDKLKNFIRKEVSLINIEKSKGADIKAFSSKIINLITSKAIRRV